MKMAVKNDRWWEVGKSLMALGNIAAGALLFGQAFSDSPFDFKLAGLGLLLLAWLYVSALALMRKKDGTVSKQDDVD